MSAEIGRGDRSWIIGLVILLVLVGLVDPPPLAMLRHAGFDLHQRLSPANPSTSQTVAIVDIDERSLAAYGQWPWPRDLLAQLTTAAHTAGARVVGLDILFPEPDRASPAQILAQWRRALPDGVDAALLRRLGPQNDTDAQLAATLARSPTVLARAVAQQPDGSQRLVRNLPALEAAASGIGLVSLAPDRDGVYRSVPLLQTIEGEEQSAFALELLRVARPPNSAIMVRSTRTGVNIVAGGHVIRADSRARVWLRVLGSDAFMRISAADLLRDPPPNLRGSIVVIGSSAAGLASSFPVATGVAQSTIALQAQITGNLMSGQALLRPDWSPLLELGLSLLCCLVLIRTELRGRLAQLPAVFAMLAGGLALGTHAAFLWGQVLIDWTAPLLLAALLTLALLVANLVQAQRLKREARQEHDMALALVGLAQKARNSFLANLSHEFRTPLNIVIGGAEIITSQALGPIEPQRYRDYGRAIYDGGLTLLGMVNRTMALASAETAHSTPSDELIDVHAAVESAVARNFPPEDRSLWTIRLHEPDTWPSLLADSQMLGTMLDSLLSNARKFAAATPKLDISCTMNRQRDVVISIADYGPGMDGAQIVAIMAPFQRMDFQASAVLQGIGFGLPLTRAMVQLHGGRLEIVRRPEGGTIVRLAFPQWRARTKSITRH